MHQQGIHDQCASPGKSSDDFLRFVHSHNFSFCKDSVLMRTGKEPQGAVGFRTVVQMYSKASHARHDGCGCLYVQNAFLRAPAMKTFNIPALAYRDYAVLMPPQ